HRLAAVAIRQLPQNRRREELHHRIDGDEETEHDEPRLDAHPARKQVVRRTRIAQQLRKNRTQDADAERVDENREQNDPDRMSLHGGAVIISSRMCAMRSLIAAALAALSCAALAAQVAAPRTRWSPPRTAWGAPDLQGVWTSDDARSVPMQRPAQFGERRLLTDEEFAERKPRDDETRGDTRAGAGTFVGEVGTRTVRQTSLVI